MYPSTRFLAFLWSVGSVLAFSKRECLKFPLTFEMISGSGPIHSQFVSFSKYLRALFKKLTLLVLFGDDARNREDLVWMAEEEAWVTFGESFTHARMVLIGDTVHDAIAAKLNNVRSLIVYRSSDIPKNIQEARPTWLVNSLKNTERILKWLKVA